jgi:hypothetical protein
MEDALFQPMLAWRIPRWALPAALCGVLAILAADLVLMRRHRVTAQPRAIPENIGLHVGAEGAGMRVQWNRGSRPIRNADHAILYIEDGSVQSQLDLTGQQLDGSSVKYWPESERVTFRLEVYRGSQRSSDSAVFGLSRDLRSRRKQGPVRAIVESARPSPFEHVNLEIVRTQTLPAPPTAAEPVATAEPVAVAEPQRESRLDRVISKIPLLRRLQKHPQSDGIESRR